MVPHTELTRQRDFLYRRLATEGTLVLARQDEIDATYIQLLVKDGSTVLNASFHVGANQPTNVFVLLSARLQHTGVMAPSTARRLSNILRYMLIAAW